MVGPILGALVAVPCHLFFEHGFDWRERLVKKDTSGIAATPDMEENKIDGPVADAVLEQGRAMVRAHV